MYAKPSKERLKELKEAHGQVYYLVVEDKACLLKAPDRKTLSYASKSAEKDPMAFNDVLLKGCFIEGDTEVRDNDSYFLGASQQLAAIVEVKESSLEKL